MQHPRRRRRDEVVFAGAASVVRERNELSAGQVRRDAAGNRHGYCGRTASDLPHQRDVRTAAAAPVRSNSGDGLRRHDADRGSWVPPAAERRGPPTESVSSRRTGRRRSQPHGPQQSDGTQLPGVLAAEHGRGPGTGGEGRTPSLDDAAEGPAASEPESAPAPSTPASPAPVQPSTSSDTV